MLSSGGGIERQIRAGARVVVVTVCTGAPPAGPLSDFAQGLHQRWEGDSGAARPRLPAAMVALRRSEDLAALAELGAEAVHLDVPDCIYRLNPATGYPLYAGEAALFGSLHPSELTLVRRLATRLATLLRGFGRQHLVVPLGLGSHVDHQLTRRAAEAAGGIYAYAEDFPYVAGLGDRWPDPEAPALRERRLAPEYVRLDEAALAAKIQAIACYRSQISTFWPDLAAMAAGVRAYADQAGGGAPAERLWRPA